MFLVRDARRLAPTVTRLVVEAPLVARKHQPGHFVMVRVAEGGERIPLTVVESDPTAGTITLIVQAVGKTTRMLCELAPGEAITDVVGPLGNPAPLEHRGAVACVGGGVGTAVLYPDRPRPARRRQRRPFDRGRAHGQSPGPGGRASAAAPLPSASPPTTAAPAGRAW